VDLGLLQPVRFDFRIELDAVVVSQFIVQFFLFRRHVAVQRLFGLARQFGQDLFLGAPQHEGTQCLSDCLQVLLTIIVFVIGIANAREGLERIAGTQHSGIQKLKQRPQFSQMIFDGGSRHGQSMIGFDESACFRRQGT
jgi:chloramphenicol 3-O-phosphotransferase